MNTILKLAALLSIFSARVFTPSAKTTYLFDGKTFNGWEGDTVQTWRIERGMITAGSLTRKVPHNEFLATTKSYKDFDLRLQFKLEGTEGFVNAGVQVRSKRITSPPYEMSGYQADLGKDFYGALYDESRRNKLLAKPDSAIISKVLKQNEWNDYRIRCNGRRIQLWVNGTQTVDYTEPDKTIVQEGVIALQIHGDGKTVVSYRDIRLSKL
jgi:hypothetical protein